MKLWPALFLVAACGAGNTIWYRTEPPPAGPPTPPDPCADAGDMVACERDRLGQLVDLSALIAAVTSPAPADAGGSAP